MIPYSKNKGKAFKERQNVNFLIFFNVQIFFIDSHVVDSFLLADSSQCATLP